MSSPAWTLSVATTASAPLAPALTATTGTPAARTAATPAATSSEFDRVEDHSVGSRGCKRPELFKLTFERLARIEHRDLHAGGGAGCLDRVRFRMKERIGEVLNDKGDCLQARRMIELSGGEFGDADPDPISSVRVAPQQTFPHQGLADVEQAALRRPQAPGDVG